MMDAIVCPKCKKEDDYYHDGLYIRCQACGYIEWVKDGDFDLAKKWSKVNAERGDDGC